MSEHPSGTEVRSVAQGYNAIMHHGDGTCTKSWGATEYRALTNLGEAITDE